jgi:4-amino-4-deoxy-L-arabinose transferase-like glycosyltransferase
MHLDRAGESAQIAPRPSLGGDRQLQVLLAITIVGGLLRLLWLAAFPEPMPDEGLWTNSTKNFLLFHDWFMGGRTHLFLSPVFHVLSLVAFGLAGPSIESARMISGLAGTASIPLLYAFVREVSADRELALFAAALFAFDQHYVFTARVAQIEALQVAILLCAAWIAMKSGRIAPLVAGVCGGIAILTKINSAIVLAVLALAYLLPERSKTRDARTRLVRALIFGTCVAAVAIAGYGVLYEWDPTSFRTAYLYELDGRHFEPESHPIVRFGRFGLDPVQAARTVIGLFRESPFLLVLAALGVVVGWAGRARAPASLQLWLVLGSGFFLAQMYQPIRYFYLVAPAYCFFAALAIRSLANAADLVATRRMQYAALGVCMAFGASYFGMNAIANPATRVPQITAWAREHTDPDTRSLCATQICTDLPHRAYDFYPLVRKPSDLDAALANHGIDLVFVTDGDWPADLVRAVQDRADPVMRWPFGAVYRVRRSS